jgi:hypothetical protein
MGAFKKKFDDYPLVGGKTNKSNPLNGINGLACPQYLLPAHT